MDQIRDITSVSQLVKYINQAKESLSPDFLLVLLGPTASGKTALAVQLAKALDGEIISADSRQIYRQLDIGTGKDLAEYQDIPYHLIDIRDPQEQYHVKEFKSDFALAFQDILSRNKQAILCGGTGSYIHSLLMDQPYSLIPKDALFQEKHQDWSKDQLLKAINGFALPIDFQIDWHSKKRLIRALEILTYLQDNPLPESDSKPITNYLIIGLNPTLENRRSKIDRRLKNRMQEGLIDEVKSLLESGLSHAQLQWFGLEYKYASKYLLGELDETQFVDKLRTEIHRFAKRQMTFFRKMEKDAVRIHWIDPETISH